VKHRRITQPGIDRRAYTIPEAAQACNLGTNTLRNMIAEGRIHAVKAGSRVIIPIASVEAFLAGKSEEAS
jgi:excisionase family DNA binding protein